ncbi:hypothetical protein TZ53_23920 (plasmid) [Sphingobium sp. YBL2]|nr:hypothetical protein TZ53_23920 [Sphingobium sp. YBL2]
MQPAFLMQPCLKRGDADGDGLYPMDPDPRSAFSMDMYFTAMCFDPASGGHKRRSCGLQGRISKGASMGSINLAPHARTNSREVAQAWENR